MSKPVTIYVARRILTMNPSMPEATHVAVREGRILAVGGSAEMADHGPATVDERFAQKTILPGFVEGHSHLTEGAQWRDPYLGFFDRRDPSGTVWPGLKDMESVVTRLAEAAAKKPEGPVTAWGLDPLYFNGPRMTTAELDRVSTDRPVVVTHASGHIMNLNSVAMREAGLDRTNDLDGLVRDAQGRPNGEIQGPELMGRVRRVVLASSNSRTVDQGGLERFGQLARRAGVTTATDLHSDMTPSVIEAYRTATADPSYPLRLVPALGARAHGHEEGLALFKSLQGTSTDMLHFKVVKLVLDGSIQGFTARLRWPGYHNGAPNGLWYIAPSELGAIVEAWHRAGAVLHIHTNGDEASEVAVEMLERALTAYPRPDHRHTLQHCQMPDPALYRRIKALGLCCNIFSNHIYYWGEQHIEQTMGLSRAERIDAAGTALRLGVPFSIHSDAPVTPLGPLFTAWCAVMRLTAKGRCLGEGERIPVAAALHAITLGSAYTLKLDHLIGSIEVGKLADFAVLDEDPLTVDPMHLKDIGVHATVVGGTVFASP